MCELGEDDDLLDGVERVHCAYVNAVALFVVLDLELLTSEEAIEQPPLSMDVDRNTSTCVSKALPQNMKYINAFEAL